MRNNRKYIIIIAVLLIIIGVLLGVFLGRHWWAPQGGGNDLEALNTPKEERILSNVRNTAIVQAVKQVGPAVVGISTKVYDRDMFNRRVLVGESVGSGVISIKKVTSSPTTTWSAQVMMSMSCWRRMKQSPAK